MHFYRSILTVLAVFFTLHAPLIASSAEIYVPADYPTIQQGILAASDGDTVIVADGVYTGTGNKNLSFGGKAITLVSESGPETCIIDCMEDRGFRFTSDEDENSILDGFTIRNGR